MPRDVGNFAFARQRLIMVSENWLLHFCVSVPEVYFTINIDLEVKKIETLHFIPTQYKRAQNSIIMNSETKVFSEKRVNNHGKVHKTG